MGQAGKINGPRARRLLSGLGAIGGFVLLGVIFAPGFASPEAKSTPTAFAHPRGDAGQRDEAHRSVSSASLPRRGLDDDSAESLELDQLTSDFDCMIRPSELVDIGSAITGRIEEIAFERSDYVHAGDTLVVLESSVEAAAVRVAEESANRTGELESSQASLELGLKKRDRGVKLYKKKSVSLDVRQSLETETRLAAARVKQAQENQQLAALQLEQTRAALERRTVKSPISGYVVDRLMAPGEVVEDETILRIAQVDPLRVEVILPASLFGRIAPGDRAQILPEAPYGEPLDAEVAIVDRIIDGASATFGALLTIPNEDLSVPAGLRCRVSMLGNNEVASAQASSAEIQ